MLWLVLHNFGILYGFSPVFFFSRFLPHGLRCIPSTPFLVVHAQNVGLWPSVFQDSHKAPFLSFF